MSIQAMKAVELGEGLSTASRRGSDAHDEIIWNAETGSYTRGSHRAGGHRRWHDDRRPARRPRLDEAARDAQTVRC